MKKILFSMMAIALSAVAYAGSWVAPKMATTVFEKASISTTAPGDTTYYYLLNVEKNQCLTQGATWGTMAALDSTGVSGFRYALFNDEAGYRLYSPQGAKNGLLFRNSATSVYTDYDAANTSADYKNNSTIYWEFRTVTGGFQLLSPANDAKWGQKGSQLSDAEDTYVLAWNPDAEDISGQTGAGSGTNQAVYMVDPSVSGIASTWALVSEQAYAQFAAKVQLYNSLNKAESVGVATASAEAVYNDASASVETINAANAALVQAIDNKLYTTASEENPLVLTDKIVNPNFDGGNVNGWSTTYIGGTHTDNGKNGVYQGSSYTNEEQGVTIAKFIEAWTNGAHSSACTHRALGDGKIYQVIPSLPAGKYVLEVDGCACYQDAHTETTGAYLFISDEATSAREAMVTENKKPQHFSVEFVSVGGDITIGLQTESSTANWLTGDNWKLSYLGVGSTNPYVQALKSAINTANEYTNTVTHIYSKSEAAALSTLINESEALLTKSLTEEELRQAISNLNEEVEKVKSEVAAYKDLKNHIEAAAGDAKKFREAGLTDVESELYDYVDRLNNSYNKRSVTIADITAWIDGYEAMVNELLAEAMKGATEENPVEVTSLYIQNPEFSAGKMDPWKSASGILVYSGDSFPNSSCNVTEQNEGETFSKAVAAWVPSSGAPLGNEELTQVIADLPAGSYVLSCSMVAQHGNDMPEGVSLFTSGNGITSSTLCQHDPDLWAELVAAGTTNQLIMHPKHVFYHMGGECVIGLRINETNCNWVYADKFKLSYAGESVKAMYAALMSLRYQAHELQNTDDVLNIYEAWDKLDEAIDNADDCSSDEVEEIKEAMKRLTDAMDFAAQCPVLIAQLKETHLLYNDLLDRPESEDEDFQILLDDVASRLSAEGEGYQTIDEVKETLAKIPAAWTAYCQSMGEFATEQTPFEMTSAILNASFEGVTSDTKHSEFWTCQRDGGNDFGYEFGIFESYNTNNFKIEQTITGLKPGYYAITVQSFYRCGENKENAKAATADLQATKKVNFYATTKDVTYHIPLLNQVEKHDAAGEIDDEDLIFDEKHEVAVSYNGTDEYYVPNDREALSYYFELEAYINRLVAHVTDEQGVMTIGLSKDEHVAGDWCPFDNFRLFYLGTEAPEGFEEPTAVEKLLAPFQSASTIYDLSGRRVGKAQKGIYIIGGKKVVIR